MTSGLKTHAPPLATARLWTRPVLAKSCSLLRIADLSLLGGNMPRGLVRVRINRHVSLKGTAERMLWC